MVDGRIVVAGDAAATMENLAESATLFRLGVVSGLLLYISFIAYVTVLHRLLSPVDDLQAALMVAFALVGAAVALLGLALRAGPLLLLEGGDHGTALPAEQLAALASLLLELHGRANLVAVVFSGLWLLPLGRLVYRSGFLPRFLGVRLILGCLAWLVLFVHRFLLPEAEALAASQYIANVAELVWVLWLLVRGADEAAWRQKVGAMAST